ncbi:MAG: thioredoxin family protein [Candidatus Thiodiazotropha sp.]
MSWLMIVLVVVAAFLILMPMLTYLSARRQVGRPVDSAATGAGEGDRLIYFYSPKCGPCRSMTPIIDRLAQDNPRVFKVNVMEDMETARAFNIRATPTTILVKDERVLDIALGAKGEVQLERMLRKVA